MARMSIDDKFLRDPRVLRLAKAAGMNVYEARGRLLEVFAICHDREDEILLDLDIDTAAGMEGFAAHMAASDLADLQRGGRKFRIRGAKAAIKYLVDKSEAGRVGGLKSGESRREKRSSASKQTKHRLNEPEAARNPLALASAPDLPTDLAPDLAHAPDLSDPESVRSAARAASTRPSKAKPSPADPTPAERATCDVVLAKLTARNGVAYRGTPQHLRLITARLREGVTEADLRKVIHYAASSRDDGGLGWESDPKMRPFLKPETLFGPTTIAKYLDPAVAWCDSGMPKPRPETPTRSDHPEPSALVLEIFGAKR